MVLSTMVLLLGACLYMLLKQCMPVVVPVAMRWSQLTLLRDVDHILSELTRLCADTTASEAQ